MTGVGITPNILNLGCFTHGKRAFGIHWTGGWVGSRGCLDIVTKKSSQTPVIQPTALLLNWHSYPSCNNTSYKWQS